MSKEPKALLITEGTKTEPRFFGRIEELFGLQLHIVCMSANIFKLYNQMEKAQFDCNVKDLLTECLPSNLDPKTRQTYLEQLQDKYAYIYFVFDFDIQHHEEGQETNIEKNCQKIQRMLQELNDETDDTRGKLYINYPMMESYRDIDSFSDPAFAQSSVAVQQLTHYKHLVSQKQMGNKDITRYTKENFVDIFKLNFHKLETIHQTVLHDKKQYQTLTEGSNIYTKIKEKLDKESMVYILNTSIFFLGEFNYFNKQYLVPLLSSNNTNYTSNTSQY